MITEIYDLLKISLPAAIVLYAMYLTTKSFLNKDFEQRKTELFIKDNELKQKSLEQILLIRLQAYERMTLFLERISPSMIIPRVSQPGMTVEMLQAVFLQDIRSEYAHNLSQQVYMSNGAWELIRKAMEEVILLVNNSAMSLPPDTDGFQLSKRILENAMNYEINPTQEAIEYIKEEVQKLFS
jgi:hypothetical protein